MQFGFSTCQIAANKLRKNHFGWRIVYPTNSEQKLNQENISSSTHILKNNR